MSGDDAAAKLLAKVIDRMDRLLFEHELEFRDDKVWEDFAEKVRQLIYEYYDDNAEDVADADFDPEAESSSSDSVSLDHSATDEQQATGRKRKALA